MKKILGILALIFLLGNCATHEELMKRTTFYKGMTKNQVKDLFFYGRTEVDPFMSCFKEYYQKNNTEILAGKIKKLYLVFENVTRPRVSCKYVDRGNGTLLFWTTSYSEAKDIATKDKKTEPKKTEPEKTIISNEDDDDYLKAKEQLQ